MAIFDVLSIWISAFFVLASMSFLFKENYAYRFAEHTIIAASAAHYTLVGIKAIMNLGINPLMDGKYINIIGILCGLLLFSRFFTGKQWLVRYGTAFMFGANLAITARAMVTANIMKQIAASVVSLFNTGSLFGSISAVITFSFTVAVILNFIYTRKFGTETTQFKGLIMFARYAILASIGYSIGNSIMFYSSLIIDRLNFLYHTWLGL